MRALVTTQVEAGHLAIVQAVWNRALLGEPRDFPHDTHDDQADALARAFNTLEPAPGGAARSQVVQMVR